MMAVSVISRDLDFATTLANMEIQQGNSLKNPNHIRNPGVQRIFYEDLMQKELI
jgi:hypothetical protein